MARKKSDVAPFKGDRDAKRRSESLRLEAGVLYATHPDGLTLSELGTDPRFVDIPPDTLKRWMKQDKWGDRRREVFAQLRKKAETQIASMLAQSRIEEFRQLTEMRDVVLAHIRGERDPETGRWIILPTSPKSLEGLVKAYIELASRKEDIGVSIANEVLPGLQGSGAKQIEAGPQASTAPLPRNDLSVDEVKAAAGTVIADRRRRLHEELAATNEDISGEEDPALDS